MQSYRKEDKQDEYLFVDQVNGQWEADLDLDEDEESVDEYSESVIE